MCYCLFFFAQRPVGFILAHRYGAYWKCGVAVRSAFAAHGDSSFICGRGGNRKSNTFVVKCVGGVCSPRPLSALASQGDTWPIWSL